MVGLARRGAGGQPGRCGQLCEKLYSNSVQCTNHVIVEACTAHMASYLVGSFHFKSPEYSLMHGYSFVLTAFPLVGLSIRSIHGGTCPRLFPACSHCSPVLLGHMSSAAEWNN